MALFQGHGGKSKGHKKPAVRRQAAVDVDPSGMEQNTKLLVIGGGVLAVLAIGIAVMFRK